MPTDPPQPDAPIEILVEDLHKSFDAHPVLVGINLRVHRGEMVAIVGGSGSGKTVLLQHIIGHHRPDSGRVMVADHETPGSPLRDLSLLNESDLDRIRRHWAVVFQRNALLTGTVLENLSLWLREIHGLTDEQILPRARAALEQVGLDADRVLSLDRAALSGGMAKRVAIARALILRPVLILYDEPTSGLDPHFASTIHGLIDETHATPATLPGGSRIALTSIIITHDTALLKRLRPRVVMLDQGRIGFDGPFERFQASTDPQILPYFEQMHALNRRSQPT